MQFLELLAPARTADIGIAAIDCGADAVYIGGPGYGARKDAGNSISDIRRLCDYAHRFGVRIFLTVNTLIYESERDDVHSMMLSAQEAGVDAFIIQDLTITNWSGIRVPLHASTQCAVRTVERARYLESLGCSRIVLERELSLDQIRKIVSSVKCEIECFVHGALCVCYSGECYLSEWLDGRSANRGECIQACRSKYDLIDVNGRVIAKDKALLSLKDLDLSDRVDELARCGVCSFKIEGRLKNESYVRNTVRKYSLIMDRMVERRPDLYCRSSFGRVRSGFIPDTSKTFNRGFTHLFFEGKRERGWSSMDTPKSMGEHLGKIIDVRNIDGKNMVIQLSLDKGRNMPSNGDGLAFLIKNEIVGVRADVCTSDKVRCKRIEGLRKGTDIYRNLDTAFEKAVNSASKRSIEARVKLSFDKDGSLIASATSEDGRFSCLSLKGKGDIALNRDRMLSMIRSQLSKNEGDFHFNVIDVEDNCPQLTLLSSAELNGLRRDLVVSLSGQLIHSQPLGTGEKTCSDVSNREEASSIGLHNSQLMRTKYCIRYELGICPVHQKAKDSGPLFLLNNGRKLSLGFDCAKCEMTVEAVK